MATKTGRKNKLERVDNSKVIGLYKSENAEGELEYFGKVKIKGIIKQINLTKKYGVVLKSKAETALSDWKSGINNTKTTSTEKKQKKYTTLDFMFLDNYIYNHDNTSIAKDYKGFYLKYIQKEIGHKQYDLIENNDLQRIINKLERLGNISRRSLKKVQETLRPFYNELIAERTITYNPAIRLKYKTKLRNARNINDILTTTNLIIPLQYILEEVEKIINNKLKLMFYIAIYCGRRFGEIQVIRWDNVIIKESFIIVHWYDNKSKRTSKFFINDKIVNLLNIIRNENPNDKYVFQTNVKRKDKKTPYMVDSTMRNKHREIVNKLEKEKKIDFIPELKYSTKDETILNLKVHDYRHFMGGILRENIDDTHLISAVLTHTDSSITLRYSQVPFKKSKEVLTLYYRLLQGEKLILN
jgi:integrase